MTHQVLGATLALRIGRPDELLRVGCYGTSERRDLSEVVREEVAQIVRDSRPVIVDQAEIGVFPNEDPWRRENRLASYSFGDPDRCQICGRPLRRQAAPDDEALDCGDDCLGCMIEAAPDDLDLLRSAREYAF